MESHEKHNRTSFQEGSREMRLTEALDFYNREQKPTPHYMRTKYSHFEPTEKDSLAREEYQKVLEKLKTGVKKKKIQLFE